MCDFHIFYDESLISRFRNRIFLFSTLLRPSSAKNYTLFTDKRARLWARNIDTSLTLQTNFANICRQILTKYIHRQAPSLLATGRLLGPWQPANRFSMMVIMMMHAHVFPNIDGCDDANIGGHLVVTTIMTTTTCAQGTTSTLNATSGQTQSPTNWYGSIM